MTSEDRSSPPELNSWQRFERLLIIAGSLLGIIHSFIMLFSPSLLLWTVLPSGWGIFSIVALTVSVDLIICIFFLLAYGVFKWIYRMKKGSDMVNTILLILAGVFLLMFSNFAGLVFLFVVGIQQF
ncbi:MAG: hypothetical protein LUQ65_00285 [Candidatus Helarchaeota archaeon]|nr:hypothetical protein [Candidatus Helarchaeota archaeon]